MIDIQDEHLCCGCEACVQICPKHCISFSEDKKGFRYPSVEKSTCIDCGICENVCPVLNQVESSEPLKVFAAQNLNEEERQASSSGGLFILLAKEILSQSGVVFGAKFDRDWNVIHTYAETEDEAKSFIGSKYVQSRIGNSFLKAKEFLDAGREVLFTGTPCHIAGLRNYLRKDYNNLLTIDVICHGVPSPLLWKNYILDKNVSSIFFRDKRSGWKNYSITIGQLSHIYRNDNYMCCFLSNLSLRQSCFQCPSKSGASGSDITLGDLWGISEIAPHLDDDKGTSVILIYTSKGKMALKQLGINYTEVDYQKVCYYNPAITDSVKKPYDYEKFWADFNVKGNKAIQKWGKKQTPSIINRLKQVIHRLINQK